MGKCAYLGRGSTDGTDLYGSVRTETTRGNTTWPFEMADKKKSGREASKWNQEDPLWRQAANESKDGADWLLWRMDRLALAVKPKGATTMNMYQSQVHLNLVEASTNLRAHYHVHFNQEEAVCSIRLFNTSRGRHVHPGVQKLSAAVPQHPMSPLKKEDPRKQRQWSGLATLSNKASSGFLLFKVQEEVSQEESLLLVLVWRVQHGERWELRHGGSKGKVHGRWRRWSAQGVFLVLHQSNRKRKALPIVMSNGQREDSRLLTSKLGPSFYPSLRRGVKCPEVLIWLCKDRAKSRRDLEECLGANGQVCILRARQYGWYGPVRIRTDRDNPRKHNLAI
ncbi:hypothetical protein IGI04_042373 [Brassica rapa subsp. trilocularis]|uniref:Uncharacterized protein n=1 Tax=Brassica rapa subsp. trilocularis TaxID=1813537 RepID=A0ABQ7KK45_BRACM|nr:hypothetical protein IGI04_042373 [Brassica rapa subsp. trilocularis]